VTRICSINVQENGENAVKNAHKWAKITRFWPILAKNGIFVPKS